MGNNSVDVGALDKVPEYLVDLVTTGVFVGRDGGRIIGAKILKETIERSGVSAEDIMIALLPYAAQFARSPISTFQVGAIAMGFLEQKEYGVGRLYLGASFEFKQQALSFVVHGEQSATQNAWVNGETGIQYLSISAPPCGYCRQFLYETTTAENDLTILLAKKNPPAGGANYDAYSMKDLLPVAFGPADLGFKNNLMAPMKNGLKYGSNDELVERTVEAANASYGVYSGDCSAVGLETTSGAMVTGRYAENAAYNPSMSPLEGALSQLSLMLPPQAPLNIKRAVLVEKVSKISQFSVTQDVLSVTAPSVKLEHIVI